MSRVHRSLGALGTALLLAAPYTLDAQPMLGVSPITPYLEDWVDDPTMSPNGRFMLANRLGGTGMAYNAQRKTWTPLKEGIGAQARWSPNGRFIVSTKRAAPGQPFMLWLTPIDTMTGLPTGTPRQISRRVASGPYWSPDGSRIVFSTRDGGTYSVVIIPFNGGDEEVVFSAKGDGGATGWMPDGKAVIAMTVNPFRFIRVDLATKKAAVTASSGTGPLIGISPDGRLKASGRPNSDTLFITDARNGRLLATYRLPTLVRPTMWMPNGEGLLADQITVPRQLQMVDTKTGAIRSVTMPDTNGVSWPAFSPDSRTLAWRTKTHLQLAPAAGGALRTFPLPVLGALAWSPDGKRIASCSTHEIALFDVGTSTWRSLVRLNDGPKVGPNVGNGGQQCRWAKQGTAVHWNRTTEGRTINERDHEVREVAENGSSRVVARFQAPRLPFLLDDTLVTYVAPGGLMGRHLVTGTEKLLARGTPRAHPWPMEWSRDRSRLLLVMETEGKEYPFLVDPRTGAGTKVPYSLPGELSVARFHPDGRHVVAMICTSCVEPNYLEKWDIALIPLNGEPTRIVTASQPTYRDHFSPSISPDGSLMAFIAEPKYLSRVVTVTLPKR